MNSIRIFCYLITTLIFISVTAQNQKIKFNSINTGGIATGEIGTYPVLQTINGVQYKKWYAGIGAGYDAYYYKTIPLFFDARRFIDKQNKFLIYGDAGYNFPMKNLPKESSWYSSYHFSGGFYGDVGVGYKTKFIKNTSFLLATGYSYKKLFNKIEVINPCLIGPCPENVYEYNYSFRRIILKAGIIF